MTIHIELPKAYWDRFQGFLAEWRLQSTRDKLKQFFMSAIWVQQNTDRRGTKMALFKPVVEVSDRIVSALFSDIRSQTKFRKLVRIHRLVVKDRSWVAGNISAKDNRRKCDGWHFTFAESADKDSNQTVRLEFDPFNAKYGMHMTMLDEILRSDGIVVNDNFVFKGKMAIDDWKAGKLEFDDLKEVYKTALQCRKPGKDSGFRSYDAISLSAKSVRTRYFVDAAGKPVFEAVDFNGAALACSKVAAMVLFHSKALNTGFGDLNRLSDKDLLGMAYDLWKHPERDVYEQLWEAARKIDFFSGALPRKWTKSARKTIKQDVTIVLNYSLEELAACRMAYLVNLHGGRKVQHNKRRQWLLWMALKQVEPTAWYVSQACRMTGDQSLFFNFYTMGEKMLISAVRRKLESEGVECTRVHDAVWTSDERVKRTTKEEQKAWSNRWIARTIFPEVSDATNHDDLRDRYDSYRKGGKGCIVQELFERAGLRGSPEARRLRDALAKLTDRQKQILCWSMSHSKDYCESSFPKKPDPKFWRRAGDVYRPAPRRPGEYSVQRMIAAAKEKRSSVEYITGAERSAMSGGRYRTYSAVPEDNDPFANLQRMLGLWM